MSELIWLDIFILDEIGISPYHILSSIKELEGEPPSGVKPATQFRNMPLKGLWHKHFFSTPFLGKNILLALGKDGVGKLVKEVIDPSKSSNITADMIDEISRGAVLDPFEARNASNKLTGEWIVYLRHEGKNYYLCCNTHDAGDQLIYDRIMEHCARDFPELSAWLKIATHQTSVGRSSVRQSRPRRSPFFWGPDDIF
jgi:hypothetical protein